VIGHAILYACGAIVGRAESSVANARRLTSDGGAPYSDVTTSGVRRSSRQLGEEVSHAPCLRLALGASRRVAWPGLTLFHLALEPRRSNRERLHYGNTEWLAPARSGPLARRRACLEDARARRVGWAARRGAGSRVAPRFILLHPSSHVLSSSRVHRPVLC